MNIFPALKLFLENLANHIVDKITYYTLHLHLSKYITLFNHISHISKGLPVMILFKTVLIGMKTKV